MSNVTMEQIQNILRQAKGNDAVLSKLLEAATAKSMQLGDAAKIAHAIAQIALAKGVDQSTAINSLVDAFKAAVYQGLVQRGERFPDANLHNSLTTTFNNAVALIKSHQQNNGGGLLGGGNTGTSILGAPNGGGVSVALGGGGGIPLTVEPSAPSNPNSEAGLSVLTSGSVPASTPAPVQQATGHDLLATAQVAPSTQNGAQLTVLTGQSDNRELNDSVFNVMDDNMENYAAHELEVKVEQVSKPAKQANADVKLFTDGGSWRKELADITEKDASAVYFEDADILVRLDEDVRTYYVGHEDSDRDIIRSFYETHRNLMSNLCKAQTTDDIDKLIALVQGVIATLRKNAVELHQKVNEGKFSTVTTAGEVRRFVNSYLYLVDIHVHNALSIMTQGGTKLPNGRIVSLERKAEDLEYFTTNVYESTVAENGTSTEEDWFRELLEMVAVSLGKHSVRCEGEGTVLLLSHTIATVVIPGMYAAVDKDHTIGSHTLASTADAISDIYEELYKHKPGMNVVLETPTSRHLLLSSGGVGAAIRY